MEIPFSKVDCSGNELKYVQEVLESGWLTSATKCLQLETCFADKVGSKYSLAVNSATSALHLALEAIGLGTGDKVFVPTMTFTASAEVIRYMGAVPVFLDIEYGSCLVSAAILENAIVQHSDIKAMILVHFGGQAAEMDEIIAICKKHSIKLIEDAAHAFPSRYGNRMVGSFGDVTCFSFYANKPMTTGEGGMLVTNDESIYERAKAMRFHGINRDIWDRFTVNREHWEYDVVAPGFKYNMSDVSAAIGLAQLERVDEFREGRQRCAEFYYTHLSHLRGIELPLYRGMFEDHSWHLFWIVLNNIFPMDRNTFIKRLNAMGIGTSLHYKPLHRMTYYRERYNLSPDNYPNAERHWCCAVSLPIYHTLNVDQLIYIVDAIQKMSQE